MDPISDVAWRRWYTVADLAVEFQKTDVWMRDTSRTGDVITDTVLSTTTLPLYSDNIHHTSTLLLAASSPLHTTTNQHSCMRGLELSAAVQSSFWEKNLYIDCKLYADIYWNSVFLMILWMFLNVFYTFYYYCIF